MYSQEETTNVFVKNQIIHSNNSCFNQYIYKITSIPLTNSNTIFINRIANKLQFRVTKLPSLPVRSTTGTVPAPGISILTACPAARHRGGQRRRRRRRGLIGADGHVGERREHAPDAHGPHGPEAEGPEPAVLGEDVGRAAEDEVDQPLDEHEHGDLDERVAELRRERQEGGGGGVHGYNRPVDRRRQDGGIENSRGCCGWMAMEWRGRCVWMDARVVMPRCHGLCSCSGGGSVLSVSLALYRGTWLAGSQLACARSCGAVRCGCSLLQVVFPWSYTKAVKWCGFRRHLLVWRSWDILVLLKFALRGRRGPCF